MREDATTYPFWLEDPAPPPAAAGRLRLGLAESFLEGIEGAFVGLDLVPAGSRLRRGDSLGLVHTDRATLDLRVPFGLTVRALNPALQGAPRLAQDSPYHRGWLAEVAPEEDAAQ